MPTKLTPREQAIADLQACQERTLNWAAPKGLLATKDATKQALYVASEAGELIDGVLKDEHLLIADGIGDTMVTLANYAEICTRARHWPEQHDWDAGTWGMVPWPGDHDVYELCGQLASSVGTLTFAPNAQGLRNRDACRMCWTLLGAIAGKYDMTLPYCWDLALCEIENRTGRTVGGVFVKDAGR